MSLTMRLPLMSLILLTGISLQAQTSVQKITCKPPIGRALWHDRIDREQRNALKADGKADAEFYAGTNADINYYVTKSLTQDVDRIQCEIETDTTTGDQRKKLYLLGLEKIIRNFNSLYKSRQFTAANLPQVIDLYEKSIKANESRNSIAPGFAAVPYEVITLTLSSDAFNDNVGYKETKQTQLLKYCSLYPDQTFVALNSNLDVPFRDSLIKVAAYRYPKRLYDFAAANNKLGYAIRNIDDPFIKAISRMATSGGSGQIYFPFLDNIISGKQSFEDIDAVKSDDAKYYKLLVKTRMDYVNRHIEGEKIISMGVLDTMLQRKANQVFIKEINGLHESPDAIRFKILQQLNAQELYYLVIAGETEMYTSSYVKGIFPLMMDRIHNRGDSLLLSVNFDRFKKFIRVAAGYNTLSDFLASFPDKDKARVLMTAFVNGLEKTQGLEDGVDVADSYASIAGVLKPVAEEMLTNVNLNYERCVAENNKRGMAIYNILQKLFLSADSSRNIDLTKELGIPPVYNVAYPYLVDSDQRVNIQVFFYGDKDAQMNWANFVPSMSNSAWKKTIDNQYFVQYSSTQGKPIYVYANKPLDEESGELDKAQAALDAYLDKQNIHPTIVVHRGHSYYAPYTIEQIQPSAKIVFLGSCGGYNLIHDVLKHSDDAHIIASKQTGKKDINQPFMDLLFSKLRAGQGVDWIPFWKEFTARAGKVDGFEDYIPPYKNLGAIFIKAYKKSMGEDEDDNANFVL